MHEVNPRLIYAQLSGLGYDGPYAGRGGFDLSSWTSAQWLADHREPIRQGSRHRQNAPYQRMQTKDGYLMVGAAGEVIWTRCDKALGHPEWCEDPRFAKNRQRMENRDALEAVMNAVLTSKTTEHWVAVLEAAGVPCGPVYD